MVLLCFHVAVPKGFPRITDSPQSVMSVDKHRSASMACTATGEPTPTVHWLKDHVPINMSDTRLNVLSGGEMLIVWYNLYIYIYIYVYCIYVKWSVLSLVSSHSRVNVLQSWVLRSRQRYLLPIYCCRYTAILRADHNVQRLMYITRLLGMA